jgi:hypothetical protein
LSASSVVTIKFCYQGTEKLTTGQKTFFLVPVAIEHAANIDKRNDEQSSNIFMERSEELDASS